MKDVNDGVCYLKPIPAETDDHKAGLKETTVVKGTVRTLKYLLCHCILVSFWFILLQSVGC